MVDKPEKPGNRGKTGKVGAARAAFDQAAALEALKWAKGGEQLALPGLPAMRFVGVEPLPDDAQPRGPGRPVGAQNAVPQAFREYLAVKYGSPVEGLAQFATRPLVSIVAELVEAYQAVAGALGISGSLTREQVLALVQMAPGLQLQARRYAAPYMHTQAPQPLAGPPAQVRIGVAMFSNGQPSARDLVAAEATVAGLLGVQLNQGVSDADPLELNAVELNAPEGNDG